MKLTLTCSMLFLASLAFAQETSKTQQPPKVVKVIKAKPEQVPVKEIKKVHPPKFVHKPIPKVSLQKFSPVKKEIVEVRPTKEVVELVEVKSSKEQKAVKNAKPPKVIEEVKEVNPTIELKEVPQVKPRTSGKKLVAVSVKKA